MLNSPPMTRCCLFSLCALILYYCIRQLTQATLRGWIFCRDNAALCVDILQQPDDDDPSDLTPQQFKAMQTLGLAEV